MQRRSIKRVAIAKRQARKKLLTILIIRFFAFGLSSTRRYNSQYFSMKIKYIKLVILIFEYTGRINTLKDLTLVFACICGHDKPLQSPCRALSEPA
jgi:hypothetical protein